MFVISVWIESFVKEFVSQDASLKKTPYCMLHFQVSKSVQSVRVVLNHTVQ